MRDTFDDSPFGTRRPGPVLARLMAATGAMPTDWASKRLAFTLRRLGISWLSGPVDLDVLGVNMRLYPFSNVCEKRIAFTPQYFDAEERALILSRVTPDFVFIDVGANVGGYALHVAAKAGPGARIIAIEPQPDIFERLVYNMRQNAFGTVKALSCAVADHDGAITLFIGEGNKGESSVKIVGGSGAAGSVEVPGRTLLSIARDEGLSHINAIKLDIEGAEDLVLVPFLRDAPQSLWPRLIVVENAATRWQTDLFALLGDSGYRRVADTRLNVAFERG